MTAESNPQTYNTSTFHTPEWWEDWSKKNYKRKSKEFSRKLKKERED
jgi:hypothetical protein